VDEPGDYVYHLTVPGHPDVAVNLEPAPGAFSLSWRRCDCPWWHRLPFAGRFVHSDLP
jgi:hypothetical protein